MLFLAVTVLTGCNTLPPAPSPALTPVVAARSPESPQPSPSHAAVFVPGATAVGHAPPVIDHGGRDRKVVALTFDADMTDVMMRNTGTSYANIKILNILQERAVPATFFVTALWARRYPEHTRRIAGENRFEIGNHSYRHSAYTPNCYGLPQLPRTEMTTDAKRTFAVLNEFGGNQTRYFRFPGLCHDAAALTALAPLGCTVIDGDVISGDPFATASAPIVQAVLDKAQAGSIIVLHITEANAQFTDEALIPILDGLARKGLTPVKLSDLLTPPPATQTHASTNPGSAPRS